MRKVTACVGIVTMLATISLVAAPAFADVIYVSNSGNDATGTGASNKPFRTIAKGVLAANGGDVVECSGVYSDNLNMPPIGKSLTIICREGTLISDNLPAIQFNGGRRDVLNLDGPHIFVAPGAGPGTAIRFRSGQKMTVDGATVTGAGGGVGFLDDSKTPNSEVILQNMAISNFHDGLVVSPPPDNVHHDLFDNLNIHNNGGGILQEGGTVLLQRSIIHNNTVGLQNEGGSTVLKDDTFFANGTGVDAASVFSGGGNSFFNRTANFTNDNFIGITNR